jgi:hypothetical protein
MIQSSSTHSVIYEIVFLVYSIASYKFTVAYTEHPFSSIGMRVILFFQKYDSAVCEGHCCLSFSNTSMVQDKCSELS